MIGYRFTEFIPQKNPEQTTFDNLLNIFLQLLVITSGDVNEALSWLTNLDREHHISTSDYGIGDFIDDLKNKGFIDIGHVPLVPTIARLGDPVGPEVQAGVAGLQILYRHLHQRLDVGHVYPPARDVFDGEKVDVIGLRRGEHLVAR